MHPKDELYALWLQLACGISNAVYLKLFTRFSSCEEIYRCEDFSFLNGKYLCERALKNKDLAEAYELQKRLHSGNIHVLTYYDDRFPKSLRLIQAPPAVLYAIGELRDLNELVGVAVVGTRSMTNYGAKVAEEFALKLTICGATVISGLAKGIDTCAHRGAIRADGYTVAVLGTPIDEIYPKENARAFHTLYQRGLVISEMYPGCRKTKGDFPNRNRLISGLSMATLIVEAGERSGALITARHAVYQNKPVFAVPGALGDAHAGTNALIKNGARTATSASDILKELALSYPTKIHPEYMLTDSRIYAHGNAGFATHGMQTEHKPTPKPPMPEVQPSADAQTTVADLLCNALRQKAMTADELTAYTGIPVGDVLAELTVLEIEGKVLSSAGNRFICKS